MAWRKSTAQSDCRARTVDGNRHTTRRGTKAIDMRNISSSASDGSLSARAQGEPCWPCPEDLPRVETPPLPPRWNGLRTAHCYCECIERGTQSTRTRRRKSAKSIEDNEMSRLRRAGSSAATLAGGRVKRYEVGDLSSMVGPTHPRHFRPQSKSRLWRCAGNCKGWRCGCERGDHGQPPSCA